MMTMNQEPKWLVDYRKKNIKIAEDKPLKKSLYFNVKKLDEFLVLDENNLDVPIELGKHNIKVLSWQQALDEIPDKIKEILEKENAAKNQYEAFINAYFNSGFIAIINKDSNIDGLIEYKTENSKKAAIKNIIIIEDGVENVKILEHLNDDVGCLNETVYIGRNSQVIFCRMFNLVSVSIVNQQAILERDSRLQNANAYLNGQQVHSKVVNSLIGEGASVEQFDLSFLDGKQFFNVELLSIHNAENAQSRSIIKSVLNENAKNLFDGMIKILPSGQKANALLQAHSLLLSKDASANNIPNLEIEADDVKATHSATVSNIDDEQLFYLESRGLNKKDARNIIIRGFLDGIIFKLPEEYSEQLTMALAAKMEKND